MRGSAARAILGCVAAVGPCASPSFTWIVTAQHNALADPAEREGHYTPVMIGVVSTVWCLSLGALIVLWFRRPHSVLDVWLMVVMCAWLFDIALSAILNVARFDLGFYARPHLRALRRQFRAGGPADPQRRPAGPVVAPARHRSPPGRFRTRLLHRARAAVQRGGGILQRRDHHQALDGTITAWNRAAERLFGFTAAEAVGKSIDIIVPQDRRAEVTIPRPRRTG